jgi:formamidopyrimidine-DNA glycosylase
VDGTGDVPHTHFSAVLDDGTRVEFIDPRTFGFIAVYDEDDLGGSGLSRLGPDAWAEPPAPEDLASRLNGRTAPIKALLLDQGPIAGLGNIYADEALFRARIHPLTKGGALDVAACGSLLDATKRVLGSAIDHGGTTLDDLAYLLPDGRAGDNINRLRVYGREGEPCDVCGTPIERVIVRARSTHFCPTCQVLS